MERLLRPAEAAAMLGLAKSTLARWRLEQRGPRWVRLGARAVAYRQSDIQQFAESGVAASTSDTGRPPRTARAAHVPIDVPPDTRGAA